MCGICGIVHSDRSRPIDPRLVERMNQALRHRGPDGEGVLVDGNAGLAHRRLSIIDLSDAGRQPMTTEDEQLWIVFNGEVYNYLELRQDLLARGHRFRSHTDTEVVLHLYEEEGPAALDRLNGMFAFAIWDVRDHTLFVARDRLGIKPLYFAWRDGTLRFASEIKALFEDRSFLPEVNMAGVADYLTFQFCLGDKTLFRDVRRLLPGHHLTMRAEGAPEVRAYWDVDFTADTDHTEQYFHQQLSMLLGDAVRLETRADVPVGAHLSGGLDSTTVTVLAASLGSGPFHTFSGGFREGAQFDETHYARLAAGRAGAVHHEVFPTSHDFVELMPRIIKAMDEPAAGPGVFPQFLVSRLAREHVKVVLGGQGGDEIFGGYTRYLIAYLEACVKGGIEGTQEDDKYVVTFESILPNLRQLQGYEPLLKQFWQNGLFEPADLRYFRLIARTGATRAIIEPRFWEAAHQGYSPLEAFRDLFNHSECHSLINRMTRFDLKTVLPALLHVEDRTSMAASLESRVPLLDHRIVELVASMPPRVKYKGGRSKHIFREVVQDLVPPEIYRRTDKMGFPVPLNQWYHEEPVRGFVGDALVSAGRRGLILGSGASALLDGEAAFERGMWGLLNLELWMQTFIDGR
jgi:asparagine synthase (glutamine-hydrolysing)